MFWIIALRTACSPDKSEKSINMLHQIEISANQSGKELLARYPNQIVLIIRPPTSTFIQWTPAPTICACTKDDEIDLATTWRLLWRDDRYIDGLIPEEERYYRFNQPEVKHSAPQNVSEKDQITWTESGTAAPKTGRWLVESDMTASIELKAGELLPLHQGRMVRWVLAGATIWQWDSDQD